MASLSLFTASRSGNRCRVKWVLGLLVRNLLDALGSAFLLGVKAEITRRSADFEAGTESQIQGRNRFSYSGWLLDLESR